MFAPIVGAGNAYRLSVCFLQCHVSLFILFSRVQIMELKTFKTKLASVVRSETTLRGNIQALTVSAVDTYAQHGDTSRIEMLVNASVTMRSVRSNTLKDFIKAHANVKFTPAENNEGFTVKKIGKGAIETKPIESDWFDFNKEGIAKPDFDAMTKAKVFLSSLDKAKDEGRAKVNAANDRIEAVLRATIADIEAQQA